MVAAKISAGIYTPAEIFVDALVEMDGLAIAGMAGRKDADPDDSRNDIGMYGGPWAGFWQTGYGGPVVTHIEVIPSVAPQGGAITVRATGTTQPE